MTKYYFIRHFVAVLLGCLLSAYTYAQHITEFLFTETAPDYLIPTMQANAKALFAEINSAYDQKKSLLTLSQSNITSEARERIQNLWKTSHFYCTKTGVLERILKMQNGDFQVRNIPVFFAQGKTDEHKYQHVVLEFTRDGKISDLYIAITTQQYIKIMESLINDVSDARHRQMIVYLVENYRTAYNSKDLSFLNAIFSENALIITGKVLTPQKRGDAPIAINNQKIEYSVLNKEQYLTKLQNVFNNNSYINIKFEDIVVKQHEENSNIYGVTLRQIWNAEKYNDEGWLFLIFDYENEDKPKIWVRTWQPLEVNGVKYYYGTYEIFGLGDFRYR